MWGSVRVVWQDGEESMKQGVIVGVDPYDLCKGTGRPSPSDNNCYRLDK